METLRNALLITLLVVLVIILYKRLLSALGKKDSQIEYSDFTDKYKLSGKLKGEISVQINVSVKENIHLVIRNSEGKEQLILAQEILQPGEFNFEFDSTLIPTGNYSLELNTANHKSSRFFSVEN